MKHIILFSILAMAFSAHAASASAYTDFDSCKILTSSEHDPNPEIDYFTSVCQGREGFDVRLDGGDLRSWISLTKHNSEDLVAEYISMSFREGQFPNVAGSKLEWRYTNGKLNALIVRMSGQDPDNLDKELVTLAVIRIDKNKPAEACVISVINAKQANANLKARAVADGPSSACLNE
jgi:hypothetical protein